MSDVRQFHNCGPLGICIDMGVVSTDCFTAVADDVLRDDSRHVRVGIFNGKYGALNVAAHARNTENKLPALPTSY